MISRTIKNFHIIMPFRRRSQETPRARGSSRAPMRITPTMQQARAVLAAQQQQIQDLQVSLANASVRGPSMPIPLGLAASAAPEKCETEMSSAAFRSWRRSMGCWLQICHWPSQEAVHHIRLHCVPELQRALDARFTDDHGVPYRRRKHWMP